MMLILLLASALSLILIMLNSFISKKMLQEREKPSPFECGFDPKSPARLPFSLRFYLIAVIFLIFDVEITLIIPMPILSSISSPHYLLTLGAFFILILISGLYHEWGQGALNWDE